MHQNCDNLKALLRTMRFDPINKAAASVNVKTTLLEPWLVKQGFQRGLSLTLLDNQISNVNVTRYCVGESLLGETKLLTTVSRCDILGKVGSV